MRIISDFHDYYDTAIGFGGMDNSCVYERKTEDVFADTFPFMLTWEESYSLRDFQRLPDDRMYNPTAVYGLVIFCGKAYPYIDTSKSYWEGPIGDYVFFVDDWDKVPVNQDNLMKFKRMWAEPLMKKDLSEYNLKYDSPVIKMDHVSYAPGGPDNRGRYRKVGFKVVKNPNLKHLNFARCVDPFQAFQEIYMFRSNYFTTKDIPDPKPLSEKQNLARKGMDQFSFKKMKEKK